MGKTGFIAVMIMSVMAIMMVQDAIAQTVHVVGGPLGWVVPGDDDVYDNWADTRVFTVGDILTFNFTTGAHNVAEVTEASYDACTTTGIIGSTITTGPANITLTTAGEHWYISTIGGQCQGGQKLDITVVAATQTVHVVGGSLGWVVPGNDDVYDNWADTRVFKVGDILTFNFSTGAHDVAEVTEASYDACTTTGIIGSTITTGPANITLTTAGEHRYICTFGGGSHCQGGQKLDITVLAAAAPGTVAPPPSPTTPTTSPPPMPTRGPAPAPSPTTALPPRSTNRPVVSPTTSPTTAPPPSFTDVPTMSPTTSPPPPSTNGPTTSPGTTSPPPTDSSSSIVLGSALVTLVSVAFGLFLY